MNVEEQTLDRWEIEQRSNRLIIDRKETKDQAIQTANSLAKHEKKTYWVWDAANEKVVHVVPI